MVVNEKQDVLNKNGKPTGEVKTRGEIGRKGLWHFSVHCWILNSMGELLVQKRSAEKESHPNMWDISVAGHVQAGLTPAQEAIREAKEELGLDLKQDDFKLLFTAKQNYTFHGGEYFNREINPVYLVEKDLDLPSLRLQKEEVVEVKWIPWQELEGKISAIDPTFVPHPEEYKKLFEYLRKNK